MNGKKGFTIVETLLVTFFLLFIASFTVPPTVKAISNAKSISAITTLEGINGVYNITSAFLHNNISDDLPKRPMRTNIESDIYIPANNNETKSEYEQYYVDAIIYSFGGTPPKYEILETNKDGRFKHTIWYWPKPEEKPYDCFVMLPNGEVTRDKVLYKQN